MLSQFRKWQEPLVIVTDWSDPSEVIGLQLESVEGVADDPDLCFLGFYTDWGCGRCSGCMGGGKGAEGIVLGAGKEWGMFEWRSEFEPLDNGGSKYRADPVGTRDAGAASVEPQCCPEVDFYALDGLPFERCQEPAKNRETKHGFCSIEGFEKLI